MKVDSNKYEETLQIQADDMAWLNDLQRFRRYMRNLKDEDLTYQKFLDFMEKFTNGELDEYL